MLRRSLDNLHPWFQLTVLAVFFVIPLSTKSLAAPDPGARDPSFTLLGGRIVRPDGTLDAGVSVVVRDGKIRQLVAAADTKGQNVRQFGAEAVVCPGLIDVFSSVTFAGQTMETTSVVDPDASVTGALDPVHPDLGVALRAGITAVMVAPGPRNLVSGVPATFRTFVRDGKLDVLRDDGPLVFAFGEGVWRQDRTPTSRAGTLYELRQLLDEAEKGTGHSRTRAAIAQQLDALIVCNKATDVRAVRGALGETADRFGLVHTLDAIDVAADLKGLSKPVVVGPYSLASARRVLMGAAALSDAGVEVAFSGGFPKGSPDSLRITAALAVRHGMSAAAARRAITIAPAQAAGVADRIGSIVPGRDGDLVVFSHDPLRLDAVVLEVYVKGVRVYAAKNSDPHAAGARR